MRCNGGDPAPTIRIISVICRSDDACASYFFDFERDVVTHPLRLLVRVGVAADVDEQRGVIDRRAVVVVEADPFREAQSDEALPQDVLHRLAEAEIDAE